MYSCTVQPLIHTAVQYNHSPKQLYSTTTHPNSCTVQPLTQTVVQYNHSPKQLYSTTTHPNRCTVQPLIQTVVQYNHSPKQLYSTTESHILVSPMNMHAHLELAVLVPEVDKGTTGIVDPFPHTPAGLDLVELLYHLVSFVAEHDRHHCRQGHLRQVLHGHWRRSTACEHAKWSRAHCMVITFIWGLKAKS